MAASARLLTAVAPGLVLVLAVLLPGAGHLAIGETRRALTFVCFMVALGWITTRVAPPEASFVGRHAGGFFVYALSITDAYRLAALAAVARARRP